MESSVKYRQLNSLFCSLYECAACCCLCVEEIHSTFSTFLLERSLRGRPCFTVASSPCSSLHSYFFFHFMLQSVLHCFSFKHTSESAFCFCAPELWNSLPLDVRMASSLNILKGNYCFNLFLSLVFIFFY